MKVNVHALAEQNMYLVALHLPSEHRISKTLPKYVDEYHAGEEEIRLVRGYFYNKLHRLNEKARSTATKYGVRVDPSWYLMNERGLQKFLKDLEKLREEYAEYEKALNDFLLHGKLPKVHSDRVRFYEDYTERIKAYLSEKDVEVKPVSIVNGIVVNVLPLQLDPGTIARVADERLKVEIQRTVGEIVQKIEDDIQKRLEELEKKLKNVRSIVHLPNVRTAILEEIENVRQVCSAYGIEFPQSLEYRIQRFYAELERKAVESIGSPRARALAKKLLRNGNASCSLTTTH